MKHVLKTLEKPTNNLCSICSIDNFTVPTDFFFLFETCCVFKLVSHLSFNKLRGNDWGQGHVSACRQVATARCLSCMVWTGRGAPGWLVEVLWKWCWMDDEWRLVIFIWQVNAIESIVTIYVLVQFFHLLCFLEITWTVILVVSYLGWRKIQFGWWWRPWKSAKIIQLRFVLICGATTCLHTWKINQS